MNVFLNFRYNQVISLFYYLELDRLSLCNFGLFYIFQKNIQRVRKYYEGAYAFLYFVRLYE